MLLKGMVNVLYRCFFICGGSLQKDFALVAFPLKIGFFYVGGIEAG